MKTYTKIALTAALSCFLASCGEQKPEDVAIETLEAMQAGDVDKMMSKMHCQSESDKQAFKSMLDEKLVKSLEKEKEHTGDITKIDVVETKISEDGSSAVVLLKINFEKAEPRTMPVSLIKLDGKWLINVNSK